METRAIHPFFIHCSTEIITRQNIISHRYLSTIKIQILKTTPLFRKALKMKIEIKQGKFTNFDKPYTCIIKYI